MIRMTGSHAVWWLVVGFEAVTFCDYKHSCLSPTLLSPIPCSLGSLLYLSLSSLNYAWPLLSLPPLFLLLSLSLSFSLSSSPSPPLISLSLSYSPLISLTFAHFRSLSLILPHSPSLSLTLPHSPCPPCPLT